MKQKIIYGILFGLIAGASLPNLTYAEELETVPTETTTTTTETNSNDCFTDENGEEICTTLTETQIEEGTSGEAEVVCADENEPGCSEEETLKAEEESEEEAGINTTWPVVVSFVALGVAVITIIIFNLLGRKRK